MRVKMLRTQERLERGETYILRDSDAQMLIAIGAAVELYEIKPVGPIEFKPIQPSEFKQEFGGKKKVKTRKS